MLDYVRTLTLEPAKSSEAQIIRMREAGFGDKAIMEINQITGFFAWNNRTVDGLGIELEAFWETGMTNIQLARYFDDYSMGVELGNQQKVFTNEMVSITADSSKRTANST